MTLPRLGFLIGPAAMSDQDRFEWDHHSIVTIVFTVAAWLTVLFSIGPALIQAWVVVGSILFGGILIFGTIGVWAICMDLYTYSKIRKQKERGQE